MIFAIATFIVGLTGWDISKVQRYVLLALLALIGIVLLAVAFSLKSCFTKTPKLNQVEIQKAQTAIATQDRKAMVEILAQSDAREKAADATEIEANTVTVNAQAESRKQWSNATNQEMQDELERRAKESQ